MKKLLLMSTIILTFLLYTPLCYAELPNITAKSYVLMDLNSGQILCEKNSDNIKLYHASTTKIMTAIVALENCSLETMMTASQEAVYDIGKDGMNIGIMAGEEMNMEQLLNALLVVSANETANIIAENICGSREKFVELMNKKALELGANNTHFTNSSGVHHEDHYTTAKDLAIISRYAMSIPKFREIVDKREFTPDATNKHPTWPTLYSSNKMLRFYENELFHVNGIKTGYTGPAGFNLVSSAEDNNGMELISVVLGVSDSDPKDSIFKYSQQLLEYGFLNFSTQTLIEKGKVIDNVNVNAGSGIIEKLKVIASESIDAVLPVNGHVESLIKKQHVDSQINAPVNQGDVLGFIEYEKDGVSLGRVDLVAAESIEKIIIEDTFIDKLKKLADNNTFLKVVKTSITILVVFIVLRLTLKRISRKVRRKRIY
jgi:D-alanyl-D-alanine carboxypeptidase (penicillin-binding protein 5/6)